MKSIVVILGLLLIAGCAHYNINGTWKGVYDTGGMGGVAPKHFVFKFIDDGKSLTGEACDTTASPDVWVELKDLKREDNKISFTSEPTPGLIFGFEGIKDGDEIALTFQTEISGQITGQPQSFTITREK